MANCTLLAGCDGWLYALVLLPVCRRAERNGVAELLAEDAGHAPNNGARLLVRVVYCGPVPIGLTGGRFQPDEARFALAEYGFVTGGGAGPKL